MCTFALLLLGLACAPTKVYAQDCSNLNLTLQSEIASTCSAPTMTMLQDERGLPYLYIAQKEGGLRIFDISSTTQPQGVDTIGVENFESLHVMNVTQHERYLYLALGNSFGPPEWQSPGLAIVDVSDPQSASVVGFYRYPYPQGGGGIVKVDGNYAYLGAMTHGLVILDVMDKSNIKYVSEILPDRTYPNTKLDTMKYNARGMAIRGDIVYLCFDAGGVRAIDVSDKQHPIELGKYSNPALDNQARAYNNIVIDDTIAYVTFDYCGIEVLSIADPANIYPLSWWNPWDCTSNILAWFSSAGHTNEIAYNKERKLLFVATGKSDLYVVNAADPYHLDSCNVYGGVENNIGTWGVSSTDSKVYLSYVCTLGIPFASNWSGVKILSYDPSASEVEFGTDSQKFPPLQVTTRSLSMPVTERNVSTLDVSITNVHGDVIASSFRVHHNNLEIDVPELRGAYLVRIRDKVKLSVLKIVK